MTAHRPTLLAPLVALGLLACAAGLLACAAAPAPPSAPAAASPPPAPSQAKCGVGEPAAPRPAAPKPAPAPEAARPKTPEEAAARLFTAEKIEAAWFTPSFVDSVPPQKIEGIVADIKKESGAFSKIDKEGEKLFAVLAKGKVPLSVTLDGEGRIKGLWFSPTVASAVSLEELLAGFRALPGKVSVLVLTDGKEVLANDADVPMAVGSAFKLAILDALRTRIDAKKAAWTDVVRLEQRHKAIGSGTLQAWPNRAPLTLHTAASLMISESDNTATDVLLDHVGRETVEKLAPGNAPFMSTRDAFVLKERSHAPLLARWRAADATGRRKMLPELAQAKLDDAKYDDEPTVDVEWMFSARRLCELLGRTKDLDVTRINPGVASPKDWDLVAYKGGSEAGVLNMTTWVEKAGKKHCVVTTWNDPAKALEGSKLRSLHASVLAGLRDKK